MNQPPKPLDILRDALVRAALADVWNESKPGATSGHEEGGFIVVGEDNRLTVRRWPRGEGNRIRVPSHAGCAVDGRPIVATFHTHPNIGSDFLQEPSETDQRGVRDDADLKDPLYVGELVIANEMIYLVTQSGSVRELDRRTDLLG